MKVLGTSCGHGSTTATPPANKCLHHINQRYTSALQTHSNTHNHGLNQTAGNIYGQESNR